MEDVLALQFLKEKLDGEEKSQLLPTRGRHVFTATLNTESRCKCFAEIAQIAGIRAKDETLHGATVNEGYHRQSL